MCENLLCIDDLKSFSSVGNEDGHLFLQQNINNVTNLSAKKDSEYSYKKL